MPTTKGAVLVTGASTGIGRAIAIDLDRNGYRVFAGVRKQEDADSLRAEASERLAPVTLDVTDEDQISAARDQVEAETGEAGLAALVNNAGIGTGGAIEGLPLEEFRRALDVNLTGQLAVTQAFLPLIRRGRGRVFFMSSIGGRVVTPFMSPYHASKFGLEAVADSLRRELKPWGLEVIVIEPGDISTPIWRKGEAYVERLNQRTPPEVARRYAPQIERMTELLREADERGIPAEKVAITVRGALEADRPRTRYLVGTDARIMAWASRLLPDRVFDRVVLRTMKLPSKAPDTGYASPASPRKR